MSNNDYTSDNSTEMSSHKLNIRVHLKCNVSFKVEKFEITGLIFGLGKQGSVRNSGEFEIAEFDIADSK